MKFEDILRDLKNKIYKPVYFLYGEEEYYIDIITDFITGNVLDEADREFNQNVLYGKDVNAGQIIDTAKRYPMMSNYQVVIVREAQVINDLEELTPYFEKPVESTILVICHKHKNFDARKAMAKAAKKNGVLFKSERIREYKIPEWVNNQLKAEGYSITPDAARLLTGHLGNDLTKIRMEMEKLILNINEGATIDADTIEQYIGISKDFNVFELQNAMGKGDVHKANLIVNHFAANPKANPLILTMVLLYQFFAKLLIYHSVKDKANNNAVAAELSIQPYFVRDYRDAAKRFNLQKTIHAISLMREYDMKSKGVNNNSTTEGELLKELVFKLMH